MSAPIHIEHTLPFPPADVFAALTSSDALRRWFAEEADVALDEGRFGFWGRFTPGTPDREEGSHAVTSVSPDRTLHFEWDFRGATTTVEIDLVPDGDDTVIVLLHHDIPRDQEGGLAHFAVEDFWFLSFENLLRHLAGRAIVRCDFSDRMQGRIEHAVEIDGSAEAVWRAITDPSQLERWIASTAEVVLEPEGTFDLGWGEGFALTVTRAEENRLLELAWPGGEEPTTLRFELEPSGSGTRLTLVHEGFAPDQDVTGIWVGWLHFLAWIVSLVEFGSEWAPAVKEIGKDAAAMYAASQVARQGALKRRVREDGVE